MVPLQRLATVAGDQGTPQYLQLLREWEEVARGEQSDQDDYNCTVDWGDGSPLSTVTTHNSANRVHTCVADGTYNVEVRGRARDGRLAESERGGKQQWEK